MKLRFFRVRVQDPGQDAEELNTFLASHRVLSVERHFVSDGSSSAWAICVNYLSSGGRPALEKRGRVDYREVLPEAEFSLFAKLRSLRKSMAEKEGVPAYALFTNEQLAEMVRRRVKTQTALEKIEGVGPARSEKYGANFLDVLKAELPVEAGRDGHGAQ
jgi:superfamily II DNA helicase RecQ